MSRGARARHGQSRRRSHPRARSVTRARSLSPRLGARDLWAQRALGGATRERSGQLWTPSAGQAAAHPAGLGTAAGCRRAELADCSGKAKVSSVCVCMRERDKHLGTWVRLRCMGVRASVCPTVGPGAWFSTLVFLGVILVGINDSGCPGVSGAPWVVCAGTDVSAQLHAGVRGVRPCAVLVPQPSVQMTASTATVSLPFARKRAGTRGERGRGGGHRRGSCGRAPGIPACEWEAAEQERGSSLVLSRRAWDTDPERCRVCSPAPGRREQDA